MVESNQSHGLWPSLYEPLRHFGTRLPGVAEDDIELTVDEGAVTVTGEKKTEREEKGETWYFSERQYGGFRRSFRLPGDADVDAVSADLRDGVLTITVPKRTEPEKAARKVPVKRG